MPQKWGRLTLMLHLSYSSVKCISYYMFKSAWWNIWNNLGFLIMAEILTKDKTLSLSPLSLKTACHFFMGFLCLLKFTNPLWESFVPRLTWEWRCLFLLQSPNLSCSFSTGKSFFCFEFYKKQPLRWRERYLSPCSLFLCFFSCNFYVNHIIKILLKDRQMVWWLLPMLVLVILCLHILLLLEISLDLFKNLIHWVVKMKLKQVRYSGIWILVTCIPLLLILFPQTEDNSIIACLSVMFWGCFVSIKLSF